MHATTRTRRLGQAVGATAVAFGLMTAALGDSASALRARPAYASAILTKLREMRAMPGVGTGFYGTIYTPEPDNDNYPNATPDGMGGFMFWRGTAGIGAIYSHGPVTSKPENLSTHAVYGNILMSWAERGYETGKGYPINDERVIPPGESLERTTCGPDATVTQFFMRPNEFGVQIACFSRSFTSARWNVIWH
jgi:hypothetical protein